MIRAASLPLRKYAVSSNRFFTTSSIMSAAQIFRMPAMSPTMTEGGVVSWKFKSGDNFSAGDVLLEVETDKATIDVEAQDDGIMWDIIIKEGESGIPVGKPIALLAEPGDDLSSLERPNLEEPTKEEPTKKATKPEPTPESKPAAKPAAKTESKPESSGQSGEEVFVKANPSQRLLPSVELLLHQNNISEQDAYEKIPASGPKGRILKGDVLAYLGNIDKSAVSKITKYLKSKEHLDLSNIVLASPPTLDTQPKQESKSAEKPKPTNIINVNFSSELGEGISKDKFKYAFERAVDSAVRITYSHRFPQYSNSPSASSISEMDIFDDLLAPSVTTNRFEVFDIAYKFTGDSTTPATDAFDELLGLTKTPTPTATPASLTADVQFKIKVNASVSDAKQFVEYFQDSLLSQIPSNKLVISKDL
ncbi:hypothetical protein HYPBUDRAFT_152541 [Hyphopichia burtonii NRRL Y-1933]|uniref:Dihydrolipoamide dehydrogenase-binding protein of pyruvate dehydrogenase complex n=1 Tax=Hyphopichia burtonii NRRL Y-1933 TaxID=984485 RepID=A0A1E4RKB2_9ASCO|nr:hypothetical protein HYPBUDRAFT_152541 [Hyphopichia burtonii NRRL Y-1933]ODV67724.1 hypothetical protein HYPBUDRAFT_152541 [Hyphopichia burtonii NRRL Y-1933]